MKAKSKLIAGLCFCMLAAISIGSISCRKSEPTPEIVTNPLDAVAYYIVGHVHDGTNGLSGVKVSTSGVEATTDANGEFKLDVKTKGNHLIEFSKNGYIPVSADATIASSATKRSSVMMTQVMTKANDPVVVNPDREVVITGGTTSPASLTFPIGAVKEATGVTVTEFVGGAKKSPTHISLSMLNCQPDGLSFDVPVQVSIKNQTSNAIHFVDVLHFIEKNGVWKQTGTASYDANDNAYTTKLNSFSNHSFGPAHQVVSSGTSKENLDEIVVDNLNNMAVKEAEIKGAQKMGWEINGDLKALLKAKFPSLTDSDITALATTIQHAIASTKGSTPGVHQSTISFGKAKVSGDTKMTLTLLSDVHTENIAFELAAQNSSSNFEVPVKTYSGVSAKITYQYGPTRTDHSGGGGD